METTNQCIPFENDNDMVQCWLNHSMKTIKHFPKPSVDKFTAKFVLYTCEMLDLEKNVFFMTIDMIGKYDCNRYPTHSILTILMLIYISNNLVGRRSSLSISTLHKYLEKTNYDIYTKDEIKNYEITVMKRLQFDVPMFSTMDELNVLVAALIKPGAFLVQFRKQCLSVLNIVYLHTKTVTDVLDEIYAKNETTKTELRKLYANNLYFPAGVLLCTVMMSKGSNLIKFHVISDTISDFANIYPQHLHLLAKIIYNAVDHFVQVTR